MRDRFYPTLGDCIVGVLLLATLYVFSILALFIGTIIGG